MALIMGRSSYVVSAMPVTIFGHILVILVTVLLLVWLLHFGKGLAFESHHKRKMLNMHALLMVLGPVLAGGEAIMAYKTVHARRRSQKAFHSVLHLTALVLGILGIYVIFKLHNERRTWNMYTLHSWLGMIAICSFGLQFVFGFFTYWWPGAEKANRAALVAWHSFIGMAIFLLITCTTETGLLQTFHSLGLGRNQEALIVNFTGLFIFLFAVTVSLTVALPRVHK